MIALTTQKGKRIALFGLGGSGMATALALVAGGAELVAWDDNPDAVAAATARGIAVGDFRIGGLGGFAALVLSPGVPLTHPRPHWAAELANTAKVPIIGDIELFCIELAASPVHCQFVAITGTNGKSTTTALTAHVLSQAGMDVQMGGNIGTAILSLEPPKPGRVYVIECSSYQIDLAPSLKPTVGVLLNISPDHLDRHGSIDNYTAIKTRLAEQSANAVIGVDEANCEAIARQLQAKMTCFAIAAKRRRSGLFNQYFAETTKLHFAKGYGLPQSLGDIAAIGSLRGLHNTQNALAAIAVASIVVPFKPMADHIKAMASFPGLEHRMEQVGRAGKVLFVNDSKATNADAAAKALASFERIYWIAGGLAKEGGIEPLASYFPKIAKAYLIGEAAPQFAASLGDDVAFEISQTLQAAVRHAASDATQDSAEEPVVLLSPACASFDQFGNFEKRGDAFRAAVLALEGVHPMQRAS